MDIAGTLMNNPAVLPVDEPTSALDQERSAEIIDLFTTNTHRDRVATILVTHDQSHLGGMEAMYEVIDGKLRNYAPLIDQIWLGTAQGLVDI
ncbi:MAG: hypothetical protein ABI360_10040 [Allobranchiibius sp.]